MAVNAFFTCLTWIPFARTHVLLNLLQLCLWMFILIRTFYVSFFLAFLLATRTGNLVFCKCLASFILFVKNGCSFVISFCHIQDYENVIANTLVLPHPCTKPQIFAVPASLRNSLWSIKLPCTMNVSIIPRCHAIWSLSSWYDCFTNEPSVRCYRYASQ